MRKDEIANKTELKLLKEKIENMQVNISTTVITNSDIKEEILQKSLEKEKVLVNLLEELKENKKYFDDIINSHNSDEK